MEGRDVFYCYVFSEADCSFSGSQTMAYVMALQQGWPTEDLKFQSEHVCKSQEFGPHQFHPDSSQ